MFDHQFCNFSGVKKYNMFSLFFSLIYGEVEGLCGKIFEFYFCVLFNFVNTHGAS